ncbi:hypothetical protein AURDEDRAFT_175678 [Auricularia subglabra TFB-10046 SS5]|uniref:Protein kinase domain-containing protein n=1 Tax=Auricularia subglabra (strain TFB-10046 / SS5) TaxID=717982 RepID=J0D7Y3_AURST|nr:hypothetical protein AURDEDRAFT_175678 [Auricularia subglabra TFB-10046 SS5]
MAKHVAKPKFRRALAYAFSVPQHVDRLSRDLADALQEFMVVALLDANARLNETQELVGNNVASDGEFRLFMHFEIDKLELLSQEGSEHGSLVVKYHRARVDRRILVVRSFEGSLDPEPHNAEGSLYNRTIAHDRILAEISSFKKSHPNVASLYGWNRGPVHERFTVLKSGFIPAISFAQRNPLQSLEFASTAFKSAARYLQSIGITWCPGYDDVMLNDWGEPTIGLKQDLQWTVSADLAEASRRQLQVIFGLGAWTGRVTDIAEESSAHHRNQMDSLLRGLRDARIKHLLDKGANIRVTRAVAAARGEFVDGFPGGNEVTAYLDWAPET